MFTAVFAATLLFGVTATASTEAYYRYGPSRVIHREVVVAEPRPLPPMVEERVYIYPQREVVRYEEHCHSRCARGNFIGGAVCGLLFGLLAR